MVKKVASNQLHDHLTFYIENLCPIVVKTLSSRLFIPSSDSNKMSQTNVSSSLTPNFTNANVLINIDYPGIYIDYVMHTCTLCCSNICLQWWQGWDGLFCKILYEKLGEHCSFALQFTGQKTSCIEYNSETTWII